MSRRLMILAAGVALSAGSLAMFMRPEEIPTARVLANLDAAARERPNDYEVRFTLARVHSLAYASHKLTTPMYEEHGWPQWMSVQNKNDRTPSDKEILHLRKSLVNYDLVTTHHPGKGLAWLGSGYMLEEASRWAARMKPIKFRGETLSTAGQFRAAALEAYRKCFGIGLTTITDQGVMHGIEEDWLARDAGQAIIQLVEEERVGSFLDGEKANIEDAIRRSEERSAAITPILFSVDGDRPLKDLVNLSARTQFDLFGDEANRTWPWITSRAAWLVWDPQGKGRITSGRQLFGTGTWWMMFKDGFAALATLDDDGDGWLKGNELNGIAAWNDRDANAKSEPGEVVPVTKWGVVAIRTSFDLEERVAFTSTRGIVLKDGRTLPAYDWVPSSKH